MPLETIYGKTLPDGTTIRPDNGEKVDITGRVIEEGKGEISEDLDGIRRAAAEILRLNEEDKD